LNLQEKSSTLCNIKETLSEKNRVREKERCYSPQSEHHLLSRTPERGTPRDLGRIKWDRDKRAAEPEVELEALS
jgi:hypothetical protein